MPAISVRARSLAAVRRDRGAPQSSSGERPGKSVTDMCLGPHVGKVLRERRKPRADFIVIGPVLDEAKPHRGHMPVDR
jgi:hypothetical protein